MRPSTEFLNFESSNVVNSYLWTVANAITLPLLNVYNEDWANQQFKRVIVLYCLSISSCWTSSYKLLRVKLIVRCVLQGAISGMIGGLIFSLWISVGSIVYSPPNPTLPVGICRGNLSMVLPPPNPNATAYVYLSYHSSFMLCFQCLLFIILHVI